MRYFIKSQEVKTALDDPYRKMIYRPLTVVIQFLASQMRRIHGGNVNVYILYIFITLIVLLVIASRS